MHVSWSDAASYCAWLGMRLPTEAEWEYAARGRLEQKRYAWGDELKPDGEWRCNIWQGTYPSHNTLEDGYLGTAPVDSFRPTASDSTMSRATFGSGALTGLPPPSICWFATTFHLPPPSISMVRARILPARPSVR